MSRARKPDIRCGPVQPFNPPELSDQLIKDLQSFLEVSDVEMHEVTIEIETRLGMYRAELISLDKKPSMASVKSEIKPIVTLISQLEHALIEITPASLSIIYDKNIGQRDVTSLLKELPFLLALLDVALTPVLLDESEARGNLPMEARRILIISLADIYANSAHEASSTNRDDFIIEVLEDQSIPVPNKRILNEILESAL